MESRFRINAAGTGPGNNHSLLGGSLNPALLSDDGRYLLFQSQATDLVAGVADGNGSATDIFVRDLAAGDDA